MTTSRWEDLPLSGEANALSCPPGEYVKHNFVFEGYMKLLKPLLLSAFLGASSGSKQVLPSSHSAKAAVEKAPIEAINMTVEKIMEARHAIDNDAQTQSYLKMSL